jgi:hypothetical protein
MQLKNPVQPTQVVEGALRFKENKIVSWLLDNSGKNMNDIAMEEFSKDDQQQFAQLIGYSVSGYSSLSYVDNYSHEVAQIMTAENISEEQARIKFLEETIEDIKKSLRPTIAKLFNVHPDDLN